MLKETYFYLIFNFIAVILGFLTLPIFTHYLTPQDFGVIAIFYLFGNFSASFLTFGLMNATYRFFYEQKDQIETFKIINFTNIFFILVFFIFGYFVLTLYFDKIAAFIFDNKVDVKILKLSFLAGCILRLYLYFLNFFIYQGKAKLYSVSEISYKILAAVISILLLVFVINNYYALIYSSIITSLIMLLILLYLNKNFIKFRISLSSLKKSLVFSYPASINELLGQFQQSFDKVYLNKFSGLYDLGLLEIANKFGNLSKIFINSFSNAWIPRFMGANKYYNDASNKINKSYLELVVLINLISVFITIFSEEIIILLTNEKFYFIKYYVPLILFYVFIGNIFNLIFKLQIFKNKKMHLQIPVSVITFLSNVVLNIILIPIYGIWGLISALILSSIISNFFMFYKLRDIFNSKNFNKNFFLQIMLYILLIFVIYYILYIDIDFTLKILLKTLILLGYFFVIVMFGIIKFNRILQLINQSVKILTKK